MPINWNLLDTQYPQKLGVLFDPNVVAEKQNRLSDLATQRDMRTMQMVQGVDQMNKTKQIQGILQQTGGDPEKAVQALLAAGHAAEAAQLKALMPKPTEPYTLGQGQIRFDSSGKEVARGLPKTEKTPDWKDPEWMMAQRELAKVRGGSQRSPMAPVAYVDPSTGKTVWGTINEAKGNEAANYSPDIQGALSGAKKAGAAKGEAQGGAEVGLDQVVNQGNMTINLVDDLLKSPGFDMAVGMGSSITNFAPSGTETRNFITRLEQLKGGQFMQAYETLKGGGQITEIEGEKATNAISRMNTAVSEKEFKNAAKEFQDVIKIGVERAKRQARGDFSVVDMYSSGNTAGTDMPPPGAVRRKR